MSDRTMGSYFSGGGLVEVGAKAAGLTPVFAVEYDPANPKLSAAIADCYEANIGRHVIRKSVVDVDPSELPWVYWAHFSPVCKSFSQANASGEENEQDVATAKATAAYIIYHRPQFVSLENVWLYRLAESWRIIAHALVTAGYQFRMDKVNMADFGVPQSRERMIVTAMPGRMPRALHATHQETRPGQSLLIGKPWVGWFEAIEDLIPGLKETTPARWQMARMPVELKTLMLGNGEWSLPVPAGEPCDTITSNINQASLRAYLCNTNVSGDAGGTFQTAVGERPAFAVTGSSSRLRALLVDSKNAGAEWGKGYRECDEPAVSVTALERPSHLPNAYLIGDQHRQIATAERPAFTVRAGVTGGSEPRANVRGRWVKLNTRCLSRFQTVPDSYTLSGNNTVDCAVIGNGVPPLFVEEMARQLIGVTP